MSNLTSRIGENVLNLASEGEALAVVGVAPLIPIFFSGSIVIGTSDGDDLRDVIAVVNVAANESIHFPPFVIPLALLAVGIHTGHRPKRKISSVPDR